MGTYGLWYRFYFTVQDPCSRDLEIRQNDTVVNLVPITTNSFAVSWTLQHLLSFSQSPSQKGSLHEKSCSRTKKKGKSANHLFSPQLLHTSSLGPCQRPLRVIGANPTSRVGISLPYSTLASSKLTRPAPNDPRPLAHRHR